MLQLRPVGVLQDHIISPFFLLVFKTATKALFGFTYISKKYINTNVHRNINTIYTYMHKYYYLYILK